MNSIHFVFVLCVYLLCHPNLSSGKFIPSEETGSQRYKRDREGDMKNFEWNFSVESPTIQVDSPSKRAHQQNTNMPDISVQFFDGFKSFGAPGEHTSRLKLEEREEEQRRAAEGWNRSKSVFIGPDKGPDRDRSCCGPTYPFRNTCCQM